jgi:glycosyltransferase involved in cell wall biosynthesis
MNVLVVTNMYPTAGSPAVGTFVYDQVASLRAAGVHVDVLHMDSRASKWSYVRGLFKLRRALQRRRYDLIHAHYVFSGVIARAQWKVPVVLTHHGCEVLGYPRWQTWLAKMVTPFFDEVVYVTEQMRRALHDDDGWVIPCGIDLDAFQPIPRDEARAALGLPADKPLVLWAGESWRPEKQFWLAEQAMARLKASLPDAALVLLTKQPHEVVPTYMSACDALVLTSMLEGSPMVVKEAMACNLPVVSVRVGDVPEVVDGTDACAIAEPDPDDIAQRLAEALQPARRTDGRLRMRRFSHDRTAAAITPVYEQAVERARTPRTLEEAPGDRPAVCIVHHYYYPQHGHVRRDAEMLVRSGYDVTVVALRQEGQAAEERVNGVDVVRLPLGHERGSLAHYAVEYGRLIGLTFWTLTRLHLKKRFRVVEIDNMPDLLVFSALVPKLTGAKVILYVFDNMPELLMVTRKLTARHPLVRLLALQERLSAMFADRVVVTQETARQLARDRGIADDKVSVVLNGPDEAIFTPIQVRAPHDRPQGDAQAGAFEIVTHGTILERFGIQILIDALPSILQAIPGARLTVYGEGEYRSALEEHARRVGVADRVTFGGWVPLDRLPDTLRRFDLGYVGMLCSNMLSNKLMEYASIGLPVVAARWPTYEEYFGEDDLVYFEAGSPESLARAIVGVYRDPASARRRAEHARSRFHQYGWPVQQHVYRSVYDDLTGVRRDLASEPATAPIPLPSAAPSSVAPTERERERGSSPAQAGELVSASGRPRD